MARVGYGSGESFLWKPTACACALGQMVRPRRQACQARALAVPSTWTCTWTWT
jgi:hypothetical protein